MRILILNLLLLLATSFAFGQNCDRQKMNVPAGQDAQLEFIFHSGIADEAEFDRGPRTDLIHRSYKVDKLESSHRVQEQVLLHEGFDLNQPNSSLLQSFQFVVDQRGGTNPGDHRPVFVAINRDARLLTVMVNLENKRIENRRIDWAFQIAQPQMVTEKVEPYPTGIISRSGAKTLHAASGVLDNTPLAFNKLNAAPYMSILHVGSQCILKSYTYENGAYKEVRGLGDPLIMTGAGGSAKVSVDFETRENPASELQSMLVPKISLQ